MSTDFSVTQNGKKLNPSLYTWDEKTRTFSTEERDLILDFSDLDNCTFKTGYNCTFKAGDNCTFVTNPRCTTFHTSSDCIFDTRYACTFNTGSNCIFKTGSYCTFKTGSNCTFDTGSDCTFETGYGCTFKTGYDCTFKTDSDCTFNTIHGCTFDAGSDCSFKTGSNCTFDTGPNCTFDAGSDCNFKTWSNCTFNTGSDCSFKTWSNCTFKAGPNCTFKTDSYCAFDTTYGCTFDAGSNCTFKTWSNCILIRRDIFGFYDISNMQVQTCPHDINGYIKDGYYYVGDEEQYPAIIADGILSEIINKKGNIYIVKNYGSDKITYLIKDGDIYSHGKTLKQARESLIYKISSRDTSDYENYTLDTILTFEQAIKMYRVITGACESGTKYFVNSLNQTKKEYSIKEIINITEGQYGNDILKEFFKKDKQ